MSIIGLPWYDPDDYPAIRAALKDGESLPATHGEWLAQAQQQEAQEIFRGNDVCKVRVQPQKFLLWCQGLMVPSTESCNLYAAVILRRNQDPGAGLMP